MTKMAVQENKEFSIEGISALTYGDKEGSIRIALHSEKFENTAPFFTSNDIPGRVRSVFFKFQLSVAYLLECQNTFILSVRPEKGADDKVSASLLSRGFGSHIHIDFVQAADHITRQFCTLNDLRIYEEVGHWPILQYIVART